MHFKEQLKILLEKRNISQIQFARELGITRARLNHYITGRSEPPNSLLVAIAEKLGVTTDYLLGVPETPDDRAPRLVDAAPELASGIAKPDGKGWMPLYESCPYPVPRSTPAQRPRGWIRSEHPECSRPSSDPYCLLVGDDSMAPAIAFGDIVCVQPGFLSYCLVTATQGEEIFAVRLRESDRIGLSLKRYFLKENTLIFVADNARYQSVTLHLNTVLFMPLVGTIERIWRFATSSELLEVSH